MKTCVQSSPPPILFSASLSKMSSSGGDESSRVSIPADLRQTIQNIREVTGKQHSDHDIFSVFKECFNDPHDTTQKLLYLDTFHEVRSKRERKKENLVSNTQGRGRTDQRNFASSYSGANNGRSAALKRQSGANLIVRGSRTALPAPNKAIYDTKPCSIKASNHTSPPSGVNNHKIQDAFIYPVNKGVTVEQRLFKSTSSEDVVELKESKASTVPVSDSVVDGTSQISHQSSTFTKQDHMLIAASNCSSQSDQVTRSEDAANRGNNQQSCLPPGDDAAGDKLPLPHIKSGNSIGCSPPTTIPSPYDSYTVAFNGIPSAATINSTHKETIYATEPLSLANLQANPVYNLSLQGQPLAFPTMQPGFMGIYQQTQPILADPTVTEPIGLAHITNQQPQAAPTSLAANH